MPQGDHFVKGHTVRPYARKDGTYVSGYNRGPHMQDNPGFGGTVAGAASSYAPAIGSWLAAKAAVVGAVALKATAMLFAAALVAAVVDNLLNPETPGQRKHRELREAQEAVKHEHDNLLLYLVVTLISLAACFLGGVFALGGAVFGFVGLWQMIAALRRSYIHESRVKRLNESTIAFVPSEIKGAGQAQKVMSPEQRRQLDREDTRHISNTSTGMSAREIQKIAAEYEAHYAQVMKRKAKRQQEQGAPTLRPSFFLRKQMLGVTLWLSSLSRRFQ